MAFTRFFNVWRLFFGTISLPCAEMVHVCRGGYDQPLESRLTDHLAYLRLNINKSFVRR